MVNEEPAQMLPLLTETTGTVFTVTADTAVFEDTHPCVLVPVTE